MADIFAPEQFNHDIPNDAGAELIKWMRAVMQDLDCKNEMIWNLNTRISHLEYEIKYGKDTGSG